MAIQLIQNLDEQKQPTLPTPDFDLQYNPLVAGHIESAKRNEFIKELDVTRTPLRVVVENVDALSPEQFTLVRRDGFGASDSSILMGVNPYQTLQDLIKQKATSTLSQEEKEVATKTAVRKGNDLEPLIIQKARNIFNQEIIKPKDMYEFKDAPYMRMNFDGVLNDSKQYIPCEIKVATKAGQRHYNPGKAIYSELFGWRNFPENVSNTNNDIAVKSGFYGIPPYYYTQVQIEMLGLDAPYGYLACMFDTDWIVHIFMIYADPTVQHAILLNAYKAWVQVEELRARKGWTDAPMKSLMKQLTESKSIAKLMASGLVQAQYLNTDSRDY